MLSRLFSFGLLDARLWGWGSLGFRVEVFQLMIHKLQRPGFIKPWATFKTKAKLPVPKQPKLMLKLKPSTLNLEP